LDWVHALSYLGVGLGSAIFVLFVTRMRAEQRRRSQLAEPDQVSLPSKPSQDVVLMPPPPSPPLATEITFGVDSKAPAVTLRPLTDEARFGAARSVTQPAPVQGRLNAMMQAIPGILVAEQHAGRHLMEVVINGDLIRAADGVGFRAMARGVNGISENARLFDPANLSTLANAGAVWQVASVLVAQKHLADISAKLKSIETGIERLGAFLDSERRSRITGTYSYLEQLYSALNSGHLPMQAAIELESAERDLLSIFDHLSAEYSQELERLAADGDTFGTEDLTNRAVAKVKRLENLASDLQLCLQVRTAAWYVLAVLPDVHGLQQARRRSIEDARGRLLELAESGTAVARAESTRIKSFWNKEETLQVRRQQVLSAGAELHLGIKRGVSAATTELQTMVRALDDSSKPMKLLLAVEDGHVVETRLAN
jgi:hypothetical protein